jgi:hypothetical protein
VEKNPNPSDDFWDLIISLLLRGQFIYVKNILKIYFSNQIVNKIYVGIFIFNIFFNFFIFINIEYN